MTIVGLEVGRTDGHRRRRQATRLLRRKRRVLWRAAAPQRLERGETGT